MIAGPRAKARVSLNDYVATVIGVIRDDVPFDRVLYADILYTSNAANLTAYSPANNDHYREIEEKRISLLDTLVLRGQSALNGLTQTAGVLTSRAAGREFFSAGTNRRMTRFTFINFLCRDFENLHDITVPDYRVRRDVERNPGGDSRVYKNKCVGCHAGQDGLGGAWAYFDWDGEKVIHTPGQVQDKMNINGRNYPDGHITVDDSWVNLWATGQNEVLGFRTATSGNGARSLGMMIAKSEAFSTCMAERAYKLVCLNTPKSDEQRAIIDELATEFEANDRYSMKDLIAAAAASCTGE